MLVCSDERISKKFSKILNQTNLHEITVVNTGNATRKSITYKTFDLIVICTPLSDEFGHELAIRVSENCDIKIILVCSPDISDELYNKFGCFGICVIPYTIEEADFTNTINFVCTETASLHVCNLKIKSRVEEIKIINKAKKYLMSEHGYTEHMAHKYIEKNAMNTRKTRKEIALGIISSTIEVED